jgi:hypothetical protein
MDEIQFWSLIESHMLPNSVNTEIEVRCKNLTQTLAQLNPDEIIEFDTLFKKFDRTAYDRRLWSAAYIIACGCSNDDFYDVRAWLITRGEVAYKRVLEDPEVLGEIVALEDRYDIVSAGWLRSVGYEAYELKTGQEVLPFNPSSEPHTLNHEVWDESKNLTRYPKLIQKFGNC